MSLKNVKVLEFVGLAPAPFCGKILADFGAKVTRIDRILENQLDVLQHGKNTLAINIKHTKGQKLVRKLVEKYDVLIDPFRPGVLERHNLGPEELCKLYPTLIYARLTGFGQQGPLAQRAGHDLNYVALSGVLSMLGEKHRKPQAPINLLADFAGGGMLCALGICLALLERHHSGLGQVVDAAMVEGAAYIASWLFMSRNLPVWSGERGENILDGGSYYYNVYETKDGGYMTVAALEAQFFYIFKQRLNLPHLTQFPEHAEEEKQMSESIANAFLQKNLKEWSEIFEDLDACVYPVVDWRHVMAHRQHQARKNFVLKDGLPIPKPAPRLSRTPGVLNFPQIPTETADILKELKLTTNELEELQSDHIIQLPKMKIKL